MQHQGPDPRLQVVYVRSLSSSKQDTKIAYSAKSSRSFTTATVSDGLLVQVRLELSLPPAALTHTHSLSDIFLGNDSHRQTQAFLNPFTNPFSGVDSSTLKDLLDALGQSAFSAAWCIKPLDPLSR